MHLAARPPLVRIMAIDQAIRAGEWPNARTLADRLEVNARTIRRDLALLRHQLHAPLEFDPVHNGFFYYDPTYRLSYFQLTEGELVALLLAERVLRQYRGSPFEAELQRAFAKISEMLPDTVTIHLGALADGLSVLPAAETTYDPSTFATLSTAVARRRRLEMVYWTAGRNTTTRRVFDPYHLTLRGEDWYVIGHCHLRRRVLMFAVQRVRSARETGETFDRPADFRVEEYLGGSFRVVRGEGTYQVVLRFRPEIAGRIAEKHWHPSQTSEPQSDGSLILRLTVNDLREIKRWVLFWGTDCEVLEPEELREAVVGELEAVLGQYGPPRRARQANAAK
jgi:predicted DNA-binding transcriptional regulator YafY